MIYILTLRYKSGDYYKIGRTDNLQNRINVYQMPTEEDITIEYVTETDDDAKYEYNLKKLFSNNVKPEWFKVNKYNIELVNYIKEYGLENGLDKFKHTFKGLVIDKIYKVEKKTKVGERGAILWLKGRKHPVEVHGCIKQIDELIADSFVRTGVRTYLRVQK